MSAEKAGGLLEQHKLLGAVINSDWSTGLDHKVAWHVIQRYYPKFGNARISSRFLVTATGARRANVIESLRRILANGVFNLTRQGVGTRPSEYALNFDYIQKFSSGPVQESTTSGPVQESTSGPAQGATMPASGPVQGTESYLQDRSTDRSTESRNIESPGAATPPPACGLTPAAAGAPVAPKEEPTAGFDALWAAWSRKEKRADAKHAYQTIAPNAELHNRLVEAAAAWTSNYQATGTQRQYKKYLHNWLKGECWLEDLPVAYESHKDAAIARQKEKGNEVRTNVNDADNIMADNDVVGLTKKTPLGRHKVEILNSNMFGPNDTFSNDYYCTMRFDFRILDGKHKDHLFSHKYFAQNDKDEDAQSKGQRFFRQIRDATGITSPNDTDEFHGKTLTAVVERGGVISYD